MKNYILLSISLVMAALPWACGNNSNPSNPYGVPTATYTPTLAASPINTPTGSATPTNSPTRTPSATATNSPTSTPSSSPTDSPTVTPTSTPTSTATNSPTPTPTNTPLPVGVTFSVVSPFPYHYSNTGTGGAAISLPITISVGTSAVWDSSNGGIHPLYLDNGTPSCLVGGSLSFPMTQALGVGTYHFHCGNHGACTNNLVCPNAGCTGMAVTLVVQ